MKGHLRHKYPNLPEEGVRWVNLRVSICRVLVPLPLCVFHTSSRNTCVCFVKLTTLRRAQNCEQLVAMGD